MIIPQLPTDNLYKFIFLSGLTLVFSSVLLFTNQFNSIEISLNSIEVEIIKEKNNLYRDSMIFELEIEKLNTLNNSDSIDLAYLKTLKQLKKNALNSEKLRVQERIKSNLSNAWQLHKLFIEKRAKAQLASHLLKHKLDCIAYESRKLKTLYFICGLGMLAGIVLTFYGYDKWLKKIQRPLDEKLKKEVNNL